MDTVYCIHSKVREAKVLDEVIVLNEDTGTYLSLGGCATVIWSILQTQHNITYRELLDNLSEEWEISDKEQEYIEYTLKYLVNHNIIAYGEILNK